MRLLSRNQHFFTFAAVLVFIAGNYFIGIYMGRFVTDKLTKENRQEMMQTYSYAAIKYQPKWYNRDKGWKGSTYPEALQFCTDSDDRYELCPLIAICPLGEDSEPLGGYRNSTSGSWVPIIEKNSWVQVSKRQPCARYDHEQLEEEVTRHVVCCLIKDITPANSSGIHTKEEISSKEVDILQYNPCNDTALYYNINNHAWGVITRTNATIESAVSGADVNKAFWYVANWISVSPKPPCETIMRYLTNRTLLRSYEKQLWVQNRTMKLLITDSADSGSGRQMNECIKEASKIIGKQNVYLAARGGLVKGRDLSCFKDDPNCTDTTKLHVLNGTLISHSSRKDVHNGVVGKSAFVLFC